MKVKFMLLVLLVGIVTVVILSTRMVRAQSEPRRIEVTAKRFGYDPGEITVKKGQPVVLVIKSADVDHGLLLPRTEPSTQTSVRANPLS